LGRNIYELRRANPHRRRLVGDAMMYAVVKRMGMYYVVSKEDLDAMKRENGSVVEIEMETNDVNIAISTASDLNKIIKV
jgi:hypothetical protein